MIDVNGLLKNNLQHFLKVITISFVLQLMIISNYCCGNYSVYNFR